MSGRKLEIRRNLRKKKLKSRKVRSKMLHPSEPTDGATDSVQANITGRRKESSVVKAKPVVVVPQWNSDTINQKLRLTTSMRVGIFNHGCKSKFVSLQNIKPMSEEMLAREASDLQRILSLANPPMAPSHPSLSPYQEEEEDNTPILEDDREEDDPVEKSSPLKLAASRAEVRLERLSSSSLGGSLGEGKRNSSNPIEDGNGSISVPVIDFQALVNQMDEELQSRCTSIPGFRRQRGRQLRQIFSQRSRDSSVGDSGVEVKETHSAHSSAGSAAQRSGCSQGSTSSSAVSCRTSLDSRWSSLPVPGGRQFGAPASAVTLDDQQTGSFLWMEEEQQQRDLALRSPAILNILNVTNEVTISPSLLASPYYQTTAIRYTKQPQGNVYHHKTTNQLNKPCQEQGIAKRTSTISFAPENMSSQQIHQSFDNRQQSYRAYVQIPCMDPRTQSHVNYGNPHPGYRSSLTTNPDPNSIFRRMEYNVPTKNIPSNPPSVDYNKLCRNITSPTPNPFYESQYNYPDNRVLSSQSEYNRPTNNIPSDHLDYRLKYYQEEPLFTSKQMLSSRKNILTLTASDSDGSPAFRANPTVSPFRPPETPESHWQYHKQKMF